MGYLSIFVCWGERFTKSGMLGGDVVSGIGEQEGVAPEAGVEDGLCPQRSAHLGCLLSPQACHGKALKHSSSKHCFYPQRSRAFAPTDSPPLSATVTLVTDGPLWRVCINSRSSGALTPPVNTDGDSQASNLTGFFNILWTVSTKCWTWTFWICCLLSGLFSSFSSVPFGLIWSYWMLLMSFWTTQDGRPVYTVEIRWRSRILWTSWQFHEKLVCVCAWITVLGKFLCTLVVCLRWSVSLKGIVSD